eukprot:5278293-Pyramimonas_sp.AAC.1
MTRKSRPSGRAAAETVWRRADSVEEPKALLTSSFAARGEVPSRADGDVREVPPGKEARLPDCDLAGIRVLAAVEHPAAR